MFGAAFQRMFLESYIFSKKYQNQIYKEALIPSIKMMFGDMNSECVIIEDNDPKHKSKICRNCKIKI